MTQTSHVTMQADTLAEALQQLVACYPRLQAQLFNDQKEVNDTLHLFINDEAIRFRGGLTAPLRDGDEIYIVPMISGG